MTRSARVRALIIFALIIAVLAAFLWVRSQRSGHAPANLNVSPNGDSTNSVAEGSPNRLSSPGPPTEQLSPSPSPDSSTDNLQDTPSTETNQPSKDPGNAMLSPGFVGTLKLIVPVVGVRPDQLQDTFTDARSEGRVHDAIDIPAPAGTPVVAAADGEVLRLFQSERGGTTIYQISPDKKLVYYYAHLQRFADGLTAGKFVRQGEVIGYVGDTGNAGAGNYHLHFSISVIADARRYWEGTNINPYPLLRK